jgi:hypothetical protein
MQVRQNGYRDAELNEPYGITINEQEEIYVTDNHNNRVQRFSVS